MASELPPTSSSSHPTASAGPGYGGPTGPPRGRSAAWRWGCALGLAGCLIVVVIGVLLVLMAALASSGGIQELAARGERIALVRVEGMIVAGRSGFSLLGGAATGSDDVIKQIERAIEDTQVRGILLRVNSPGGSAAASQEIYRAVKRAREQGVVVVASMADVAASGGYYVAAAADAIYADPATMTGSIGAIAVLEDLSGLLDKLGVEAQVVKSGELKDLFSPLGGRTEEELAIVRALVAQVHEQFIADVAAGRGMDLAELRRLADGRVYTGEQAKENGLVDELGGMHEALLAAGELAGIPERPRLKEYEAPGLLRWLLGGGSVRAERPVTVSGGLLYSELAASLTGGALGRMPTGGPERRLLLEGM